MRAPPPNAKAHAPPASEESEFGLSSGRGLGPLSTGQPAWSIAGTLRPGTGRVNDVRLFGETANVEFRRPGPRRRDACATASGGTMSTDSPRSGCTVTRPDKTPRP